MTRRMQKKSSFYFAVLLLLIFAGGCTSHQIQQINTRDEIIQPAIAVESEPSPSPHVSNRKIVLGFSQVGAEGDWRKANTLSIQEAAAENGIELKFMDAEQNQEYQIQAIRKFISEQVDVIAFSPVVQSGWEPILREAKLAEIPVIITDRTVDITDPSLYVTFMGSDFYEEGTRAGKYVLDVMMNVKGPIHIVELQGTVGSTPTIDRKRGFEDTIKANASLKIVQSESGNFTREQGKQVMESFLKSEGNTIQALYAHNDDMALGAIEAIEKYGLRPGKDIIIISVDGTRKALEAMINDKINYIIECNPLLGPQLMQAVKELIGGKILPKQILTKDHIFTKENAEREIINRKY